MNLKGLHIVDIGLLHGEGTAGCRLTSPNIALDKLNFTKNDMFLGHLFVHLSLCLQNNLKLKILTMVPGRHGLF